MNRIILLLFLTVNLSKPFTSRGQIFPKEGSKLCYRIIGFSFPAMTGATKYKIEIAKGNYNTEGDFDKNITTSITSETNRKIGEAPYWGCAYTWRVVSFLKNNVKAKGPLYHFGIKETPDVDTNLTRLKIIKQAGKYKDAYVFIDNARVLYDMNGRPVWFLPGTDFAANANALPRDMKITPEGTITFMTGGLPYEITYDGNILWHYKGNTNNEYSELFNHDFTYIGNGHYMGMVTEILYKLRAAYSGSIAKNAADSARFYEHTEFGSIKEYDKNGNVVWTWDGYNYIKNSDLFSHGKADSVLDLNDLHDNAIYFDKLHKVIYFSYRNISRIIKIKYPEGKILNTYGTIYKPGVTTMYNDQFCWQHSCRISQKGYLYLYDNNTCGANHLPVIKMLAEPANGQNDLKEVWDYTCTIDDPVIAEAKDLLFYQGGNVLELPDQSMFVSMGKPYCKIFIVSHDKKELWSAVYERYNSAKGKWEQPSELYRASIIASRKELERLIWNSEK